MAQFLCRPELPIHLSPGRALACHDVDLRTLLTSDPSMPTAQLNLEDVLWLVPGTTFSRVSLQLERVQGTISS